MKKAKPAKHPDTKRLDFIVRNRIDVWPNQAGTWTVMADDEYEDDPIVDKSLRKAIDKAMKSREK